MVLARLIQVGCCQRRQLLGERLVSSSPISRNAFASGLGTVPK